MYKDVGFIFCFCENLIKIKLPWWLYFEGNVCLGVTGCRIDLIELFRIPANALLLVVCNIADPLL